MKDIFFKGSEEENGLHADEIIVHPYSVPLPGEEEMSVA